MTTSQREGQGVQESVESMTAETNQGRSSADVAAAPVSGTAATTLAVVVTAGVTPYLHTTLSAVAAQTLAPGAVLIVDVASRANGLGDGTPVEEVISASGLDRASGVRLVRVPEAPTFLSAVRAGLAKYAALVEEGNKRKARRGGRTESWSTASYTTNARPGSVSDSTTSGGLRGPSGSLSPISRAEAYAHAVTQAAGGAAGGAASAASAKGAGRGSAALGSAALGSAALGSAGLGDTAHDAATGEALWLWLLHDDSAPAPDCLAELLEELASAPSAAMAGPKQVDWDHPEQLLEVGLRTTASARRANDIVPGEIDQGQHDQRRDVLAVGTAGALVDRALLMQLRAPAADVDAFGDGLLLSHALRLQGKRVLVVPEAVIRHRRASYLGLRGVETVAPEPNPDRSFRARRRAQLRSWATTSTRPLGLLLAWMFVLGLARGLWRALTKEPVLARDEVAAAASLLPRVAGLRRDRRALTAGATVSAGVLSELYMSAAEIRQGRRDRARQEREAAARAQAPSELELREIAELARSRRRWLWGTLILVALAGGVAISPLFTTRALSGGALPSLAPSWQELWAAAWSTWAASADGYSATLTPFLAMMAVPLAPLQALGIDGDLALHALLSLALPLASLGAWYAAGTITRRVSLRAWAALAWAFAPAFLLSLGEGRLAPLAVHLILPWALLALSRALGTDRRDVVLSGLVGAHHLTDSEKEELDRFSSERLESLAEDVLAEDARAEAREQATSSLHSDAEPRARASASVPGPSGDDGASSPTGASSRTTDAPAQPVSDKPAEPEVAIPDPSTLESYGPGSVSAAALAGLLFSLIVAASPAAALLLIPALLVLGLSHPRRLLRMLLALLPVVATALPSLMTALGRAISVGGTQGLHAGLASLLTETGVPVAAPTPSGLDLLLGMPVSLAALLPSGPWGVVALIVAVLFLLAVPALAVLGLLARRARGARARLGILLALGGLLLAALAVRHIVAVGSTIGAADTVFVPAWAGSALSIAWAGWLIAALAGLDAARTRLSLRAALAAASSSTTKRGLGRATRALGAALGVVVLLAPLGLGAAWVTAVRTQSNAALFSLAPAQRQVPVIAADLENTPEASRVLMLTSTDSGLTVSLWRGENTRLLDVTPSVLAAQLEDRSNALAVSSAAGRLRPRARDLQELAPQFSLEAALGETPESTSAVSPELSDAADAHLASAVARAISGQDEQAAADLAQHGIAVVVLAERSGDEQTSAARAGLSSTPGLESLAQTEAGTSWRVAPSGQLPASRTLVSTDGSALVIPLSGGAIEASDAERTLILAERTDGRWRASVGGVALESAAASSEDGEWRQAFTVPAGVSGELSLEHTDARTYLYSTAMWGSWIVAALLALPLRRRKAQS